MAPWQQILSEELSQLTDFLERRLPYSILVLGCIEMKLRYDLGLVNCQIYRATDPDMESVVVAVTSNSLNSFQIISVYFDEGKVSDDKLASLLACVPELDWARTIFAYGFSSTMEKLRILVTDGRLGRDLKVRTEDDGVLYTWKGARPTDVSLPDSMRLGKLSGRHTDLVQSNWRHGHMESREGMELMLENLPSAAVFVTDPNSADGNEESQPVAWTQNFPYGVIGNTFTLPEYQRKGLASTVTLALARKLAASRQSIFLIVENFNEASKRMHEKMGFKAEGTVSWDVYLPPGVTMRKV